MTPQQLTVGSLFSGIGGIDLGLQRAGFKIAWQVEIDPYAQKVLTKHWPHVARYGDIRTVGKHNLTPVDLLAGGFPCQDISTSGTRAGIAEGTRSGLWSEFYRIVCELQPQYVLVENVSALLFRGIERVLGDLAQSGYDAEWQCIRASDVGAPHRRERIFIIAYPNSKRCDNGGNHWQGGHLQDNRHRYSTTLYQNGQELQLEPRQNSKDAPNSHSKRLERPELFGRDINLRSFAANTDWWTHSPNMGRVVHGLPNRVDRLRGLGNAVVPQVAEYIGRCILDAVKMERAGVA
jgi:DNA (cytosine-5)-methyltransferase 1